MSFQDKTIETVEMPAQIVTVVRPSNPITLRKVICFSSAYFIDVLDEASKLSIHFVQFGSVETLYVRSSSKETMTWQ